MTTKDMKSISFDGGQTIYQIFDTVAREGLNGKQDIAQGVTVLASSGTISLQDNTFYSLSANGNITVVLPNITNFNQFHQIVVQLYMSTAVAIDLGTTHYLNGEAPDMSEAGYYTIIWEYDNIQQAWKVGVLRKSA